MEAKEALLTNIQTIILHLYRDDVRIMRIFFKRKNILKPFRRIVLFYASFLSSDGEFAKYNPNPIMLAPIFP